MIICNKTYSIEISYCAELKEYDMHLFVPKQRSAIKVAIPLTQVPISDVLYMFDIIFPTIEWGTSTKNNSAKLHGVVMDIVKFVTEPR